MTTEQQVTFAGGRSIAMKVPARQWEQTVSFYRETLGMRELDNPFAGGPQSVGFEFGANRLWIDPRARCQPGRALAAGHHVRHGGGGGTARCGCRRRALR